MKQTSAPIILGIAFMILLASQSTNAAILGFTKQGYPACISMVDFDKMETLFLQRDFVAVNKMVEQGRCILLRQGVEVYAWKPMASLHPDWAEIRLPGSTETLWTFWEAIEKKETHDQKLEVPPPRKYEHFLLKSFLWMKSGMTKKQEIVRKYGKPDWEDVAGGELRYYGTSHHPDFKEWISIRFIFDGDILEEIRVMREKEK